MSQLPDHNPADKRRQEVYQQLLESLGESYFEIDLNGKLTVFNDYICAFHGRTRDELAGLSFRDFIPEDQSQGIFDALQRVFQTGHPSPILIYDVICKDGTIRTAETVAALRRDMNGQAVGFCGIARDVTERKKTENALRESEESYRRIMELSPLMILITSVSDGRILVVNDVFCTNFGYPRQEALGKTTLDLKLYCDPEVRSNILNILRNDSKIERLEVQLKDRHGSIHDTLLSARLVPFNNQECILGVFTDISELKATQRALEEREKHHLTILEAFPYSVTITRLSDSRYLQVNKGFTQRTGYTPNEVIGKSSLELNIFKNPDQRDRLREAIFRDGRVDGMEITFQGKDGRVTETVASARRIQFGDEDCLLFISADVGELKRAQRELSESEEGYRTIMQTAPYSITISRISDGRYLEVNDAFTQRTGYTREEAIGRTSKDLEVYNDSSDFRRLRNIFREHGRVDSMEVQFRTKSGQLTNSLASARPIQYHGEDCFLFISTNIDSLKKAQKALSEREESYRTILDTAPYTIVITRLSDAKYVEVNNAFCKRTGYTREETIGRTPLDLNLYANPADRERMIQTLRRHGQVEGMEARFRTKDGRLLESLISSSPIRYKGEDCVLTMTVDINALKKTQRALEESEARFRTIFETAADPIFLTDAESGSFKDVNMAACRHLGYGKDDILKRSLKDILDPDAPAPLTNRFGQPSGDAPVYFEAIHVRKDGSKAIVEVSSQRMVHQGRHTLLSIVRDVTQRKETEAELVRYRQQLEQMVAERTRDLEAAQAELVKSERLAVLGQLTATVSHELRNPLGVIRSSNFYLQRKIKDKDEKTDKHFNRIEEQIAMCDAIVADLLEYTRGRHASIATEDPTPWLLQVVDQIQEQEGIEISVQLEEGLQPVPHDQEKMRRVIINVLLNAIYAVKAKAENGNGVGKGYSPQVTLTVSRRGEQLVFDVADNGIGMDDETRRRAFEPLFTTRARGTGIGLANVKKIIEEHSGDIILESRLGEGTRIQIGLPYGSGS